MFRLYILIIALLANSSSIWGFYMKAINTCRTLSDLCFSKRNLSRMNIQFDMQLAANCCEEHAIALMWAQK